MKKAIALLLTLSFLIIAIGLIGSIFLIYKKLTTNSFEYSVAEDSFIVQSVKKELKKVNINNSDDLKSLLFYHFTFDKDNYHVTVSFSPIFNKININEYYKNGHINYYFDDIMNRICDKYDISNCEFLKDLMLDTLDSDKNERMDGSEIRLYKPFINGRIYNKEQFIKILDYYEIKTKDKNIEKVPWFDIFDFNSLYTNCNNLSFSIADILGVSPNCNSLKSFYGSKFMKNLDIMPFDKKIPYYVRVNVQYSYYSNKYKFYLIYDVKNKRILTIEKHILY